MTKLQKAGCKAIQGVTMTLLLNAQNAVKDVWMDSYCQGLRNILIYVHEIELEDVQKEE